MKNKLIAGGGLLLWAALTLPGPHAYGDVIVPVSQDRSISASASASQVACSGCGSGGSDSESDSANAANFNLFNDSVSASAVGGSFSNATATANQVSQIFTNQIAAIGSASASGLAVFCIGDSCASNASGFGNGHSKMKVTFTVDSPTSYVITGTLAVSQSDFGNTVSAITLTGPGDVIIFGDQATPQPPFGDGVVALNTSGVLPAGQYTLLVDAVATASGGDTPQSSISEYNVNMAFAEASCADLQTPPANDQCSSAIEIFTGDTEFCTGGATSSGPPVTSCGNNTLIGADIWFTWVAPCTGTLIASTCNQVDYDSKIAVYGVNGFGVPFCPNEMFPLIGGELVGCNDDANGCSGFSSFLTVEVEQGIEYRLRIGGYVPPSGTPSKGGGTLTLICIPFADLNGDGHVTGADLGLLLSSWGRCAGCPADLNLDGIVDGADLGLLLGAWTG